MERDAVLNLRLPSAVKEALARAADEQLRSTSSMAAWALAEWLTEHGHLPKQGQQNRSAKAKTKTKRARRRRS